MPPRVGRAAVAVTGPEPVFVRGILAAAVGFEAVRASDFQSVDLYWDPVSGAGEYKVLQGDNDRDTMVVVDTIATNPEMMENAEDYTTSWQILQATVESNSEINARGRQIADRIVVLSDSETAHYWTQNEIGVTANAHFVLETEIKKRSEIQDGDIGSWLILRIRETPTSNYIDPSFNVVTC